MNQVTYFITERCNRKCEYCDVPTIENPKDIDIELFLKYEPYVNADRIILTGGEIGLLPEETLDVIFNNILVPINVNTNGLFLEKGYPDKWYNKIDLLDYHIIDDNFTYYYFSNIRYILVAHAQNLDFIEYMHKKYYSVPFLIRLYDDKVERKDFILKKKDIKYLIENYNVDFMPKEVIEEKNHGIGCYVAYKEIDWVNGYLLDCCKCVTKSPRIKITKKNLKKFMTDYYSRKYDLCKNCDLPIVFLEENLRRWMSR